jgi:hypothetical protein
MIQAFGLVQASLMSHPWARNLLVKAQKIVSFFWESSEALLELQRVAKSTNIGILLSSAERNSFMSVYTCAGSLVVNKNALLMLLREEESKRYIPPWVVELVEDKNLEFWEQVDLVGAVLAPYCQLIALVHANLLTVADVTRYWMMLARQLLRLSRAPCCSLGGSLLLP